ncbi:MAG: DUF2147 domain-containing protein [Deltaproteobacteria bacterium]|nr:DUF2147 domain-containing protein [Deltaproteobacteria bacterium]
MNPTLFRSLIFKLCISALCGAVVNISFATFANAQELSPVGKWKTIDDNNGKVKSIVEIRESGGKLYGNIIRLFPEPGEDLNPKCDKCEGGRKNQPVLGMNIMWGLTKDGSEWSGGVILDPENGKTYKCYVEPIEGGKKLKLRGYIGFSLLGRTQYWLRAD